MWKTNNNEYDVMCLQRLVYGDKLLKNLQTDCTPGNFLRIRSSGKLTRWIADDFLRVGQLLAKLEIWVKMQKFLKVLFNQALIHVNRQRYEEALELLQKAEELAGGLMHEKEVKYVTDLILNKQYEKLRPMEMSLNCIFHPPKSVITNLDKRQYLPKAKVVAAYDVNDASTDFDGTKRADQLRLERLTPKTSLTAMPGFIKQFHQANKHEGKKVGELSHACSTEILQDGTSTGDMTKSITLGCAQEEREMSVSILNGGYGPVHKLCSGLANLISAISLSSSSENIFGRSEDHLSCHSLGNIEEDAAVRDHVKEKGISVIKARSHPLMFLNKPVLVHSRYGNDSATVTRPPPPSYPPPRNNR